MTEVLGPLNAKAYMKAPLAFKFLPILMAEGSGPLNAKTFTKASLAFKFLPTPTCFNGGCERSVGLQSFFLHMRVFMAVV